MDILKEGDMERFIRNVDINRRDPRKFICDSCGCEFMADKNERRFILHKLGTYAACPTCGTLVRKYVQPDYDLLY